MLCFTNNRKQLFQLFTALQKERFSAILLIYNATKKVHVTCDTFLRSLLPGRKIVLCFDDNKPTLHQIFIISGHGELVQTMLSHLKCP